MPIARDEYGLSPKERAVADLYRAGPDEVRGNATLCYMQIHPRAKRTSASAMSCRMLRKVKIKTYLELMAKEAAKEASIDAAWLLKRLAEECTADLADIYHEDGSLKPIHSWPKIWRQGLVAGLDVDQKLLSQDGVKIPDGYITKIKISDRAKRLEMLGKHKSVQAFETEQIQVGVAVYIEGKDAQA
jgi:phage terminase small subunit